MREVAMFLWGGTFIDFAELMVSNAVLGGYGTGKSLLGVALSMELSRRTGWPIYSNLLLTGVKGALYSERDSIPRHEAIILYDESWQSLMYGTSPRQIRNYLAYLRHDDLILVQTSVLDLARNSYLLYCWRSFNFGVFGIPAWRYKYQVAGRSRKKPRGSFFLLNPGQYFKLYDHHARPKEIKAIFDVG